MKHIDVLLILSVDVSSCGEKHVDQLGVAVIRCVM